MFFVGVGLSGKTLAATKTVNASWDAVTHLEDDSVIPPDTPIIYKVFGGDFEGQLNQIAETTELSVTTEVNLSGNVAEFYFIACIGVVCSLESNRVIVQCGSSIPKIGTLQISLQCN